MSFKSNKPGIVATPAQQTMWDSFVALGATPAGQHLAKDASGNFVNTADSGGGGGTPGGSTTQLQYNNAGAFGGITGATSDGTKVTFLSTGFEIADATTNTKKAVFNVASITAATTRTLTVQNSDGTLALLSNNLGQFGATTSAQLASVISDETGTGALVFATSPTLVAPVLGVATATSINKVTITAPATSATLTIANGKTLTANNSLTLAGTDGTTMTFPSTNASIARTDAGQTFTGANTFTSQTKNKSTYQDIVTATDGATVTFNCSLGNYQKVTLGGNRTLALSNIQPGQMIILDLIQDGTGSRTVTWFTTIKWAGGSAPTLTTTANKIDTVGILCTSAGNYQGYIVGQNI